MFFNKISIIISSSVIVLNSVAMDSALPLSEAQDLVAKNIQLTQLMESKDKEIADLRLKLADLDDKLKIEDEALVATCTELADAAYLLEDETYTTTPLSMFCLARIFDLIQSAGNRFGDDRGFKMRVYDALLLDVKPISDEYYRDHEEHRRTVIPMPSEVNGWWDPQMMRNLVIFGTENPTNPRPGVVIRKRQPRQ